MRNFIIAFVFLLTVGAVNASISTDDLLFYYSFDEGTGTIAEDSTGTYNATLTSMTWIDGKIGNATKANITSSRADSGHTVSGNSSTTYTMNAWFRTDVETTSFNILPIASQGSSSDRSLAFYISTDTNNRRIYHVYATTSPNTWALVHDHNFGSTGLDFTEWNMITVVRNSSTSKIYVNGVSVSNDTGGATANIRTPTGTYDTFLVGQYQNSYSGSEVDEFAFFDVALTHEQISELYNNGSGLAYPFTTEEEPDPSLGDFEVVLTTANGAGNWTIPVGVSEIDVLVVGGGGGGGRSGLTVNAGGGGAGGLIHIEGYDISKYTSYIPFSVGSGGAGSLDVSDRGTSGEDSVFGNLTAIGGGGGGSSNNRDGISGGSGGGGGQLTTNYGSGGSSTQSTTNDGYSESGYGSSGRSGYSSNAGGGGGAGGAATNRDGGAGLEVWNQTYARGGDSSSSNLRSTPLPNNTGYGGHGTKIGGDGLDGAHGIIIIRYNISAAPNLTITAKDSYDQSIIEVFEANITIGGTTTTYNTTNGTINTGIPQNDTVEVEVTISSPQHFPVRYEPFYLNDTNTVFEGTLTQAYVRFYCEEIYTNTIIPCEQPGISTRISGSYNEQINASGYYPVQHEYNITSKGGFVSEIPVGANGFSYESDWINPQNLNDNNISTYAYLDIESSSFEYRNAYWNFTGNYDLNPIGVFNGVEITLPEGCRLNPQIRLEVRYTPPGGVSAGEDQTYYCMVGNTWTVISEQFGTESSGVFLYFGYPIFEEYVRGFYNYNLTISALDFEGNVESDFIVNLTQSELGISFYNFVNGTSITYSLLSGYEYNTTLNATSTIYGDPINSIGVATITNQTEAPSSESYQFNLSAARMILIRLFDEETMLSHNVLTNISFVPIEDSTSLFLQYNTSNENLTIYNVPVGRYKIVMTSEGYIEENRYIDLRVFSSNIVSAYFRANDTGSVKTFNVVDRSNIPQNGWYLKAQRYYNQTGWVTVDEGRSNIDGTLLINLLSDEFYRVILLDSEFVVQYQSQRTFLPAAKYEVSPSASVGTNTQISKTLGVQTTITVKTHINGTVYFEASGVSTSGSRDWKLDLYRYYTDGPKLISSNTGSGDGVTLSVDVPNQTARYEAVLSITGSQIPVAALGYTWGGGPQVIGSAGGIFAFFILLAIVGVGTFSAPVAIVMSIVGLIVSNIIGLFSIGIASIIGLIFAGGLILFRRNA